MERQTPLPIPSFSHHLMPSQRPGRLLREIDWSPSLPHVPRATEHDRKLLRMLPNIAELLAVVDEIEQCAANFL